MLSGVGPKEHLRAKGIEPIHHLSGVGKNLQDHVGLGGLTFLFNSPSTTKPMGAGIVLPRVFTLNNYNEFIHKKSGPLYASPFCEVTAFVNTEYDIILA